MHPQPIHTKEKKIFMEIKRGDIYFAVLDHGIGSEQSGYRPVLVIQNNVGNQYSPTVIVAAITSKVQYFRETDASEKCDCDLIEVVDADTLNDIFEKLFGESFQRIINGADKRLKFFEFFKMSWSRNWFGRIQMKK